MSDALLQNPVWPNGPLICARFWLPAFDTVEAAKALTRTVEGDSVKSAWRCKACGKIHVERYVRPPAGASSGVGREPWPDRGIIAAKREATEI